MYPVDIFGTVVGESPDSLLLSWTVVGENPNHVCWVEIIIAKNILWGQHCYGEINFKGFKGIF